MEQLYKNISRYLPTFIKAMKIKARRNETPSMSGNAGSASNPFFRIKKMSSASPTSFTSVCSGKGHYFICKSIPAILQIRSLGFKIVIVNLPAELE